MLFRPGPRNTSEFQRIISLPQRDPDALGEQLSAPLTEMLRTPEGTMRLWPLQALALAEAYDYDGVLVVLPVGKGKTIVSFLLPTVMESTSAVLLVPGALVSKTRREFEQLRQHWVRHENYAILSYEYVSTHPEILDTLAPDLIVADEAHRLKNRDAACTKRVMRFWQKAGNVRFVPLSGTLASRSFYDYWHLQIMALPDKGTVLPVPYKEAELWASALDVKPEVRASLGALSHFGTDLDSARHGYGQFFRRVPAVIAADSTEVNASLQISIDSVYNDMVQRYYDTLVNKWELPNGKDIQTGPELYRHAREISLGFYYTWLHPGPDDWMEARRTYGSFVRSKLRRSRRFDTFSQIDAEYADAPEVFRWKEIEHTFKPRTAAVWLTDEIIVRACEIAILENDGPVLVWYSHKATGYLLSQLGLEVYGSKGLNVVTGESIYDSPVTTVAVAIGALSEGFNLQAWSRNIIIGCPGNGKRLEQLIGRTHRPGQESDEVSVRIITPTECGVDDFKQALDDARYISATTAQQQKLVIADIGGDIEMENYYGNI